MRVVLAFCIELMLLLWAAQVSAQRATDVEAVGRANGEVVQLFNEGRYPEGVALAEETLAQAERTLGPEHPLVLTGVNNLANLYRAWGRYGEAEPLYLRALDGIERVLGPQHPDTLISVNNLASFYGSQGRYGEAEPLLLRSLAGLERTLGPEHSQTLISVNNLAGLYQDQSRLTEAEELYRRALQARERTLGPEHPNTLISINNLASLYQDQGRLTEAEELYRRALEASKQVLGPEHPDTLGSVNNLANLYRDQGRYGEAEELYRRNLEASERVLGPEHPNTLTSAHNLANLYRSQRRFGEAEKLYRRALAARERILGPEHPDTLGSVNNLAGLYWDQGRLAEAEPLYQRTLEASERVLGLEHPLTLISINNLASLYQDQGRLAEAEPLFLRALEAREQVLGPEHPNTLTSVHNLANLYRAQDKYGEAELFFRRALEGSERVLGPEHPNTLLTRGNFAALLVGEGHISEALEQLRALDQGLWLWLGTEVRTTRTAAIQRQLLRLNSVYQDVTFSLALAHSSEASAVFATDLALRWKKRLAQGDALLTSVARQSVDPQVREAVAAVRAARDRFSNVAFDLNVAVEERTRLREALEAAEAELRRRSFVFARVEEVATARTGDVQNALPPEGALVEYRVFSPFDFDTSGFEPTHLLAIVLTPDDRPAVVDLGEAWPLMGLQSRMAELQRQIGDADIGAAEREAAQREFDDVAREAHAGLIAPLQAPLEGMEKLVIAPDGPLQALPFEALLDSKGRRLVESVQVHMVLTGRDLIAQAQRDQYHPARATGLVAVGGVDFGPLPGQAAPEAAPVPLEPQPEVAQIQAVLPLEGNLLAQQATPAQEADAEAQQLALLEPSPRDRGLQLAALGVTRGQFGFTALAESGAEATNIADTYAFYRPNEPVPVVLTGTDATEGALKALPAPPRVLHLATHGFFLEDGSLIGSPLLQSGVGLAGANQALLGAIGADSENGVLHAVEAQTLNLAGTELMVLSACKTGLGVADYSEGLEGLPRAFYVAGAENVLVTLWPVDDLATRAFMEDFYKTWLSQEGPSDPAQALHATKLAYITSLDPSERDPAAWSPYVLFEG